MDRTIAQRSTHNVHWLRRAYLGLGPAYLVLATDGNVAPPSSDSGRSAGWRRSQELAKILPVESSAGCTTHGISGLALVRFQVFGRSRHFTTPKNLVDISGVADISSPRPKLTNNRLHPISQCDPTSVQCDHTRVKWLHPTLG